jgi:hypothetical protein
MGGVGVGVVVAMSFMVVVGVPAVVEVMFVEVMVVEVMVVEVMVVVVEVMVVVVVVVCNG